eukprot:TRINITY_DN397_c0_g2_i1.p1 TRINITY_DN397_c0_g2~~TRINITY_DN397_c0_g2_i1.p1  ORF type:complete len:204 (-),score=57.40 TRINITY_DN397_c0_g2_i1:238-849(-)
MTTIANREAITLKGSTQQVTEYFNYAVNQILFLRGVYPTNEFKPLEKYNMKGIYVTTDPALKAYINDVMAELGDWIMKDQVQRVVLVMSKVDTAEPVERWSFSIKADKDVMAGDKKVGTKDVADVRNEISAVMRQITSSGSFLPYLNERCSFEVLVYTDISMDTPENWTLSDAKTVKNSTVMKMRSFDTSVHKVETAVSYSVS